MAAGEASVTCVMCTKEASMAGKAPFLSVEKGHVTRKSMHCTQRKDHGTAAIRGPEGAAWSRAP